MSFLAFAIVLTRKRELVALLLLSLRMSCFCKRHVTSSRCHGLVCNFDDFHYHCYNVICVISRPTFSLTLFKRLGPALGSKLYDT